MYYWTERILAIFNASVSRFNFDFGANQLLEDEIEVEID
jgi:hypothetical protein